MSESVIDRIRNSAGTRLGVTKTDIAQELNRLADTQDTAGLQALFLAYCEWEARQAPDEEPSEQRTRCQDNFYVAAQIGDCIRQAGNDLVAGFRLYEQNPDLAAETAQFVGTALQYTPPPPVADDGAGDDGIGGPV